MCALPKSATDLTLPSWLQSSSSTKRSHDIYHDHNDNCHEHNDDHHDNHENLPNSGEGHETPPEGVKERPRTSRVVLG